MPRKQKFRPEITRIKLNPEQAVLACNCVGGHVVNSIDPRAFWGFACHMPGKGGCGNWVINSPNDIS
jgi:hypothetical protein